MRARPIRKDRTMAFKMGSNDGYPLQPPAFRPRVHTTSPAPATAVAVTLPNDGPKCWRKVSISCVW
jgi:hypothetical protein